MEENGKKDMSAMGVKHIIFPLVMVGAYRVFSNIHLFNFCGFLKLNIFLQNVTVCLIMIWSTLGLKGF